MRRARALSFGALTLTLALAGCGDAAVTGPITLTSADITLLYQELATTFSRASLDRMNPGVLRGDRAATRAAPRISLSELVSIGVSVNCTGGGTANFSGTDTSTPTAPGFDASVTYNACQTTHFQLDGNYHETVVTTATGTASSIATTGTGDLTVKVLADGRAGKCHIDFNYTVASMGITASGSICGVAVTATLTS